eukprot:12890660-Prorocentrum_lima.AAC.1
MSLCETSMETIWQDLEAVVSEVTGIAIPGGAHPLVPVPASSAPAVLPQNGNGLGDEAPPARRMTSISGGNGLE